LFKIKISHVKQKVNSRRKSEAELSISSSVLVEEHKEKDFAIHRGYVHEGKVPYLIG